MDNKHICVVSPSLKIGGIERALTVLADYFSKKGYEVSFISAQGGERFYSLNDKIHFFEPNLNLGNGVINKIKKYISILFFIRTTVNRMRPDVVLSFGDAFNPIVLLALTGSKIPIYISDRTSPDFKFGRMIRLGKRILYPRSSGFIAQTKIAANHKMKHFNNRLNIKVIPNALKEIRDAKVKRKKQIVCVGRLSYEKGQDRLIKAFSKIEKNNWRLALAGSGPTEEQLKLLAKELDCYQRIDFLGKVEDVDTLLCESSIFVLPSRLEGFPNALCEAMAVGLPVICYDSIPTEALLEHNISGIILKEGDIDGLTFVLNSLIDNESERSRLGQNAIKIKDHLNIDKIGNEFLTFILNV